MVKVALGLVAFAVKPWLGLLFFAAYAVCGSATYVADQYVIVTPTQTTSRTTSEGTRIVARPGR